MADMTTAEKLAKVYEGVERTEELNAELEQTLYGTDTGGKSFYDILWDNLQQNGKRVQYVSAFAYTGWNDKNYNPKYPITPTNSNGINGLFLWNQQITDTKVPITVFGSASQAFYQCVRLKRIPKLIFSGTTNVNNMFSNCSALEELYCEGTIDIDGLNLKDCTKLSKESITSIINALSTATKGLTVTLSKVAVNTAFETSEGANDGELSSEWDALGGENREKKNWTISLS